ncbi:Ig-like domain-containing protein [Flavivirga sp. 57AJ16]|uniref:Ig-like domain-containing protein n=1 Tax=Flavivirga sp. 57AJ16 TaxID=3025307 RepID=UPI002366C72C|nr:Ig-like domain-containing protein [Flavivirga sp. 57AJ16]MDD7886290.1 Ig-like domain-containing protein [Flavivirga sp. 57AJ16]
MNTTRNIFNRVRVFSFIFCLSFLVGCNDDDNNLLSLSVLSITANGNPLEDGAINIPVNSIIEIAFSSQIEPSKFEGLLSITDGSVALDYTISYSNATTKATIMLAQMEVNAIYNLSIPSGDLGPNGEFFQSGIALSYVTNLGKTPCLNGSDACIQSMPLTNGSGAEFDFDMYSNYDFIDDSAFTYNSINQLVIVVHGLQRNANDYFSYMASSLKSLDMEENTLFISPYFKDSSAATGNDLYWDNGWREGANSSNPSASISSFTVIDAIIEKIVASGNFPNLTTIFVTGHSSGAAFVQHYALANRAENTYADINFEYSIANNQYFYYPDGLRYDENSQQFITPTGCSGYDFWPYGYAFSIPYLDGIEQSVITEQQVTRKTTYLLGSNDTSTEGSLNTTDCQATLLGENRLKRGENIYLYMQTFYGATNNHEKIIVNNVGHDANGMYNSSEFKQYLIDRQ